MIQIMTCIWWALLIVVIVADGCFAWQAWESADTTEGYDFFGYCMLLLGCFVMTLIAAATICAIKYVGG